MKSALNLFCGWLFVKDETLTNFLVHIYNHLQCHNNKILKPSTLLSATMEKKLERVKFRTEI